MRSKRVIGLDIARSVAILAVLFSHFAHHFHHVKVVWFVVNFAGILGVQLFFVLSGFLIGGILLKELRLKQLIQDDFTRRDVLRFWKRRWYRTLPNYLICFVILVAYARIPRHSPNPTALPNRTLLLYPLFLQNFTDPKPVTQFFSVSWSLSVEEWAYFCLPLLLVASRFFDRFTRRHSSLIAIIVMILAPLIARLTTSIGLPWDEYARKLVVYRLNSIGYGVLLAYISVFRSDLMKRITTNWSCALGALLVLLMWVNMAWEYPDVNAVRLPFAGANAYWMNGFWSVFVDMGVALIIARCSIIAALPTKYRVFSWLLIECSVLSYSLYLYHPLVMDGVDFVFRHFADNTAMHLLQILFYTIFSIAVSAVVYRRVEKPIMNFRDRVVPERV